MFRGWEGWISLGGRYFQRGEAWVCKREEVFGMSRECSLPCDRFDDACDDI